MIVTGIEKLPLVTVVSISGAMDPGSAGNQAAVTCANQIVEALAGFVPPAILILDLTALEYVLGDAIGTLWIKPQAKYGLRTILVAAGLTARALKDLIMQSIAVPIVSSIDAALDMLREA